ncbi:hypothetical protein NOVO_02070 [Rickettsiales bacterium Ac37b]|nr:hypothetical protein NOVO_02070 [Rickettsiales bacterium Ac37b]
MAEHGYKIQFLYGAQEYPAKDDREFMSFIEKRLSTKWEIVEAKSLDEWLNVIEQATMLVSGRFHHSIAAACLKTPFIALNSNTPKIEGMLKALGVNKMFSYNDDNLCNELLRFTENIDTTLHNITPLEILANKAMNNFVALKKIADQEYNCTNNNQHDQNWQDFIKQQCIGESSNNISL